MADQVVGEISEIQGDGTVLIQRADGEIITARLGQDIMQGDIVITSANTQVKIDILDGEQGLSGFVAVSDGNFARFDDVLFANTASLLPASSESNPVNVGSQPNSEISRIFAEVLADDGDQTTSNLSDPSGVDAPEREFRSAGIPTDSPDQETVPVPPIVFNDLPAPGASGDGGGEPELFDADPLVPERESVLPSDGDGTEGPGNSPTSPAAPPSAPADVIIPIVTENDTFTVSVDKTTSLNVLENDTKGFLNATVIASDPSNGSAEVKSDGSIVYTPNNGFSGKDSLTYTVISGAQSSTATTEIYVDGQSVAVDDNFTTDENISLNGNVLSGDSLGRGIDTLYNNAAVVADSNGTTRNQGTYTIDAAGNFTYVPRNLFAGEDTFSYVLRDVDGDTATATVTIKVNQISPTVTIAGDSDTDITVAENSTAGGALQLSAPFGIGHINIAGTSVTLAQLEALRDSSTAITPITTPLGVLTITSYSGNSNSGTIEYSYDPTGDTLDHSNNNTYQEDIVITMTDTATTPKTSVAANLDITIADTTPTANDDTPSVSEGSTNVTGNAFSGTTGGDNADVLTDDADTVTDDHVTDVDFGATDGTVGAGISGNYGSFTINADGGYTYNLDNTNANVQGLKLNDTLTDAFTYTITDRDGSTSNANITVTINGVEDAAPVITIPNDNAGTASSDSQVNENDTVSGTFTFASTAGLASKNASDTALSIQVDGVTHNFTAAQLQSLTTTTLLVDSGNDGNLTLNGYSHSGNDYIISYTFDPTGTSRDHTPVANGGPGDEGVLENYTLTVTDNEGDSNSSTLDLLIQDTAPAATNNDAGTVTEDSSTLTVTGNAVTENEGNGVDSLTDVNANPITAIVSGSTSAVVSDGSPNSVAGTYGTLTIDSTGAYTYTLDNGAAATQALKDSNSPTETFTYTLQDGDGDTTSANIVVTVQGIDEPPSITIPDNTNNLADSSDDESVSEGSSLTGGTFTITAEAGLAATGTALTITDEDTSDAGSSGADLSLTLSQLQNLAASNQTVVGVDGTMVLNNYSLSGDNYIVSYDYTPTAGGRDHSADANDLNVVEQFSIVATDTDGNSNTPGVIDLLIQDTAPTAAADALTVSEENGTVASGNLLLGGAVTNGVSGTASADDRGADTGFGDGVRVVGVSTTDPGVGNHTTGGTGVGSTLTSSNATDYGTFQLNADGTFTYTTDSNADALEFGQNPTETFWYTIEDADGDRSTTSVTVTIQGQAEAPVITTPDRSVVESSQFTDGTFTLSTQQGFATGSTDFLALTIDGATTNIDRNELDDLTNNAIVLDGDTGNFTLTNYDSGTGVITYRFDPDGSVQAHTGGNDNVELLTVVATDTLGRSNDPDILSVSVTDAPVDATNDNRIIVDDANRSNTASIVGDIDTAQTYDIDSNAVTPEADVADSIVDAATVTNVSTQLNDTSITSTAVGVGSVNLAGDYGTLAIQGDGTYSYIIDNTNDTVRNLDENGTLTETFTYTLTETADDNSSGGADSDTATLTVTINGVDDVTTFSNSAGNGGNGTTLTGPSVLEGSGATSASQTFTVSNASGITSLLVQEGSDAASQLSILNATTSNVQFVTNEGTLTVTDYNASTGVVTYTYTEDSALESHTGQLFDSFSIIAVDDENDTESAVLNIEITDTAPTANSDTGLTLTEDLGRTELFTTTLTDGSTTTGTTTYTTAEGNVFSATGASAGDVADTMSDTNANPVTNISNNSNGTNSTVASGSSTTITGVYGNLVMSSSGAYTYSLNDGDTDTDALISGQTAAEVFTYTITDGDNGSVNTSSATLTFTINGADDAPINTSPALVTIDQGSTTVVNFTGSNAITSADADGTGSELLTVTLTVSEGTIAVGADVNGATSTGNATSIVVSRGSGSEADMQSILQDLTYTPTGSSAAGDIPLTITSRDDTGLVDTDMTLIRVLGNETTPALTDLAPTIPDSTGLLMNVYDRNTVVLTGANTTDNGSTLAIDASTVESALDAATPDRTERIYDVGTSLLRDLDTSTSISDGVTLLGENTHVSITGLIYLDGSKFYQFDGWADDIVHIELGGQTVVSSNNSGSVYGTFAGHASGSGSFTNVAFDPPASGYYTVEIYASNIDSSGQFLLNLNQSDTFTGTAPDIQLTNPVVAEFSVQNFNLYASTDDLIAAGGRFDTFVPNSSGGATDGGYFPANTTNDIVGVSGQDISIAQLPVTTSTSEVIDSITIRGFNGDANLDGVQIVDKTTNTVLFTGGAGNNGDSFTFTPLSTLNATVNLAGSPPTVDLSNLVLRNLTTVGSHNLTIDADSRTLSGTGSGTSLLTGATFTVGVVASSFQDGVDAGISSANDGDDNVTVASGIEDTKSVTGADTTNEVLLGGAGHDVLVGSGGDNLIQGGDGNDIIRGGRGDDVIVGGTGSDTLTGDGGSDTFAWRSGDTGGTDTIVDFQTGSGGDVLDLGNLLQGAFSGNAASYLSLSGTTLTVDTNGATDGVTYDDLTIELTGLANGTTLNTLITNGNIDVGDDRIVVQGTTSSDDFSTQTSSLNEIIFSGGVGVYGRENVVGNGGNDTLVMLRSYAPNTSDTSYVATGAKDGRAHVVTQDLTIYDQTANKLEQDSLDISDIIDANWVDANNDGLYDGTNAAFYQGDNTGNTGLTRVEVAVEHLHFFRVSGNFNGVYIDFDGLLGSQGDTVRNYANSSSFILGISDDGNTENNPDVYIEFKYADSSTVNVATVDSIGADAATIAAGDNSAEHIQRLVDIGFLVIE